MSDLGNREIFSKNLRYYMNLKNIDRNKLCTVLKLPYSTVTDWINGNSYPNIGRIEMLANYFEIEKSDLIENHENETKLIPEFRAIERAGKRSSEDTQKKMYNMLKIAFEEAFKNEDDT